MIAVFPGSFDPLTYGHMDVIARAAAIAEKLYAAILINPDKKNFLPVKTRLSHIEAAAAGFPNVEAITWDGLLADLSRNLSAVIIKGVRGITDFEYESSMAYVNKRLYEGAETLFLHADGRFANVSSSLIRQIASYGGDVSQFTPEYVEADIRKTYKERGMRPDGTNADGAGIY